MWWEVFFKIFHVTSITRIFLNDQVCSWQCEVLPGPRSAMYISVSKRLPGLRLRRLTTGRSIVGAMRHSSGYFVLVRKNKNSICVIFVGVRGIFRITSSVHVTSRLHTITTDVRDQIRSLNRFALNHMRACLIWNRSCEVFTFSGWCVVDLVRKCHHVKSLGIFARADTVHLSPHLGLVWALVRILMWNINSSLSCFCIAAWRPHLIQLRY